MNRLFETVYVLLNKNSVTAKELADRFGVSQRTIYRDLDILSVAGIPVYTERGRGGGIRLLPEFVLNKSLLNDGEQNEILTALQGLSAVNVTDAEGALRKLSAVFSKNAVNWLTVDFSGWGYQDKGLFNTFKAAILERKVAEFDYYSSYGEKTNRRIEPLQLCFKARAWYVAGFCLARREMRFFKLTRVTNLQVKDVQFEKRILPTARQATSRQKPLVNLKLKIAARLGYRVLDEFAESEWVKQTDGSFIVNVLWPEDDWVYGVILSFGEYAEVLAPSNLRAKIKGKAEKIAESYRR